MRKINKCFWPLHLDSHPPAQPAPCLEPIHFEEVPDRSVLIGQTAVPRVHMSCHIRSAQWWRVDPAVAAPILHHQEDLPGHPCRDIS